MFEFDPKKSASNKIKHGIDLKQTKIFGKIQMEYLLKLGQQMKNAFYLLPD